MPSVIVQKWLNIAEAIDAFADNQLLTAKSDLGQKLAEAFERGHAAEDEIRKLTDNGAAYPEDGTDAAREVDRARRMMQAAAYQRDLAKDGIPPAWEALRADVHKKLSSGILVAKGFRSPHNGGAPEITIPQDEWRILALDNVKSEVTTKHDSQVAYVGVLIGKPEET